MHYSTCLMLPPPAQSAGTMAVLRQALLDDLNQHAFGAQMAHDWAVKQLTGATSVLGMNADYSKVDPRRYRTDSDVSALVDDVHRLMAMYPAAIALDGIYANRGYVSRDGHPYLVVNDHYADAESVSSIVGPDFRVDSKPSLAFPIVTLAFQV